MDRIHRPASRPTPAPAGIYPDCPDCHQSGGPGHTCPPVPVPSPKALAALVRLETWAAWVLRDRQQVTA